MESHPSSPCLSLHLIPFPRRQSTSRVLAKVSFLRTVRRAGTGSGVGISLHRGIGSSFALTALA